MKHFLTFGFLIAVSLTTLFSCQKELSQESDLNLALFSFQDDSTANCYPIEINGTYYSGVSAERDTNFVKVVVNVKSTGNYFISSSLSNGFRFSDSGFFSKVGMDTILLKAYGTPILFKLTDFTVTSTSDTSCPFTVDVRDSTGTGLGGIDTTGTGGGGTVDTSSSYSKTYEDPNPASDNSWHFTDSTNNASYSGSMPLGSFGSLSGISVFATGGTDSTNVNLLFSLLINFPTGVITTGAYPANNEIGFISFIDQSQTVNDVIYNSDAATANEEADPSYINITSYDPITKRIKGSFRLWATDVNGAPALLKGSFNTVITL